jgi:hypothetical protein
MRGRWKLGVVALVALVAGLAPVPTSTVSADPAPAAGDDVTSVNLTPLGVPRDVVVDDTGLARSTALEPAAVTEGTRFAGFNTMSPVRILDTRATAPIGPGQTIGLQVAGRAGVPGDAAAVVMNMTVTEPSTGGYLTVWPSGTARPGTSSLNMTAGQTVANLVVVRLGAGGAVSIFNDSGTAQVLADVVAWTRDDGHVIGLTPERIVDTRASRPVGAGAQIDVPVLGRGGVPASGVGTVILNVTVTNPTSASYLTVWPTGDVRPNASSLNMLPGQSVPNLVFARVGAGGQVSFFNERGDVDVLADVVGYLPSGAAYLPINPQRIMDTRTGAGDYGRLIGSSVLRVPGKLAQDQVFTLDLGSVLEDALPGGLGSTMAGVVLNVTAVDATAPTYLSVWPSGSSRPNASNINLDPGGIVPNAVVVRPGAYDRVNLYNAFGAVHVIVDLVGYVPLQNVDDALDVSTASKFHVLYVRGADSSADVPTALAAIRSEVAALDGWFALPAQAGRHLNFDRTAGGDLEIDVVTLPQYTRSQLVNWEQTSGYPVLRQLAEDGWGNGQGRRWLVYFDGDREAGPAPSTCGIAYLQFTTVFMENRCGAVNGTTTVAAVGGFPGGEANAAQVALHEMLHGIGAVPSCAPRYTTTGGGHVATKDAMGRDLDPRLDPERFDLMYYSAGSQPKFLDIGRDDYFGHGRTDCPDLANSPYLASS